MKGDGKGKRDFYDRYTSTAALAGAVAPSLIEWSSLYFAKNFAPLLPQDRAATICDVGCGFGRYLYALREMQYSRVVGVDLSPEQVEYARTRMSLPNVHLADATEWLQKNPGQFNAILLIDILEHIPSDQLYEFCIAVRDALAPAGRVIIQVPNDISPMNPVRAGDITHFRAFTVRSIRQLLLTCDLAPNFIGETRSPVQSLRSAIRWVIWATLARPAARLFVRIFHGVAETPEVYTANMVVCAERRE